jgi:hypothetical protein
MRESYGWYHLKAMGLFHPRIPHLVKIDFRLTLGFKAKAELKRIMIFFPNFL